MFSWFTSKSVKRTPELLQDPYAVYDLKFLEWEQRQVLSQQQKVCICVEKSRKKENKTFELIFKKDRILVFVLFRDISKERVETLFHSVKKILNIVSEGIATKNPLVIAPLLREIVDSIRCNPKWTSAHIAAKTDLDNLFINSPNDITSNLNAQKEPDFSTPLHLVIQSGRVSTTKALLTLKPRLDLRDKKLNTALHFAAMSEKDILVLILKEPNILEMLKWTNKKHCTPLHLSCFANKSDNVLEFLRFGMTVQMMTVSSPEKKQKTLFNDKKIMRFTQEDIDDLDTEDMICGGTPLHWVKHRRTLHKLLKMGFGLDVVNVMAETALYTMVKRLRLKCMIGLLCNGAGVEVSNRSGDCPLHCAVKAADVTSTQALIVFYANIDAINKKKESARHMAAKAEQADHQMVLYLLTAIGAKRCDSHMKGCSPGCAHNGTYEGKPYHRWPLYHNETLYKEGLLEPVIREATKDKTNQ
jgi:ankyrin repeat protein